MPGEPRRVPTDDDLRQARDTLRAVAAMCVVISAQLKNEAVGRLLLVDDVLAWCRDELVHAAAGGDGAIGGA